MSINDTAMCMLLSVATGMDLSDGRISNKWLAIGCVAALGLFFIESRAGGILDCLLGMALPVFLLMPLFSIGVLGGGDIKLLSMTGCFLGGKGILCCMAASFVLGGLLAVGKMLWFGIFRQRLLCLYTYIKGCLLARRLTAYDPELPGEAALHFSVPVLLSVWFYMEGFF